jgi:SagB-type dehydrogenase family enzyme
MSSEKYYLSPYCVCYPELDNETVTLIHSYYGTKFNISASLFQTLSRFLGGTTLDKVLDGTSEHIRELLETLIAEQVLVDHVQFEHLRQNQTFKNRLQPVELAFHRGFNEGGYFPELIGTDPPPAAWKEYREPGSVQLRVFPSLEQRDLVQCLSQRRSTRCYSDRPLALSQLEQFLQLTGKAYGLIETKLGTTSMRNYPSAGARYPLEIYPVIYNVQDLPSGCFHYHPFHHQLVKLPCTQDYVSLLLRTCKQRMGTSAQQRGDPAIVFIITAVFARMCWKYRGTPHHLILNEVGALYQTMYLAANLLNLAACPIGAFPGMAIDEMLRLDGCDESTVGIFLLGNPEPPDDTNFIVKHLRGLDWSPFSSDPARKSVELIFTDDQKEIIDLQELRLELTSDQKPFCYIRRGRQRAFLSSESAAHLKKLLKTL